MYCMCTWNIIIVVWDYSNCRVDKHEYLSAIIPNLHSNSCDYLLIILKPTAIVVNIR